MFTRFKTARLYIFIQLILIVCASLLGFLSSILASLLARMSPIVQRLLVEYRNIVVPLLGFAIIYLLLYFIRKVFGLGSPMHQWHRRFASSQATSTVILICTSLVVLVALSVVLYEIAFMVLASPIFKKYNLVLFLAITFAILQFVLRNDTLRLLTWNKLGNWLTLPKVEAITVGALGVTAKLEAILGSEMTLVSPYTNWTIMVPTTLCAYFFMLFALLTERVGRIMSMDDDGNIPQGWFYTAFAFAFLASVTLFALLMSGFLIMTHTHLLVERGL